MKKARKGFKLIELLIVIVIIGILAATLGLSMGNATASAKAATIVSNVEACKTAALLYYRDNIDETGVATQTAEEFLKPESSYVPTWEDFSSGAINYKAGAGQGYAEWNLLVDFSTDADAPGITEALKKTRNYKKLTGTSFTVVLSSGAFTNGTSSGGTGGETGGGTGGETGGGTGGETGGV